MNATFKKVVLFGPPLAGKGTLLEAFAASKQAKRDLYYLKGQPTSTIADVAMRFGFFFDTICIEFHTLSGSPWFDSSWETLFYDADAMVLVLDPQVSRSEANKIFLKLAQNVRTRILVCCMVITKQDLATAGVSCDSPEIMLDGFPLCDMPIYFTRYDEPHTLCVPLNWITKQLLELQSG